MVLVGYKPTNITGGYHIVPLEDHATLTQLWSPGVFPHPGLRLCRRRLQRGGREAGPGQRSPGAAPEESQGAPRHGSRVGWKYPGDSWKIHGKMDVLLDVNDVIWIFNENLKGFTNKDGRRMGISWRFFLFIQRIWPDIYKVLQGGVLKR